MRTFLVIVETNHKERESFIHYCEAQDSVVKLMKLIEKADTSDLWGDVSHFSCSWGVVPEEAVDAHVALTELGCYDKMFQKHVGVFKSPEVSNDPAQTAHDLDKHFYACRLGDYFKK